MNMSNLFFDCVQTEAQNERTTCPKLLAKTVAGLDQFPGPLPPTALCHLRSGLWTQGVGGVAVGTSF